MSPPWPHARRRAFRVLSLRLPCAGTAPAPASPLSVSVSSRRSSSTTSSTSPNPPVPTATPTPTPISIAALLRQPSRHSPSSCETLTVNGFVRSVRKQKRVAFAALGDGSSLHPLQAVLTPQQADGLSTGVAVALTGRWTPSPGAAQTHELHVDSVRILGQNDAATSPLQKKFQTPEFLRTLPHLRTRLPLNSLLLRLRSLVTAQTTNYFANRGFIQVHPPIITSSDCEGAGEVFTVAPEPPAGPTRNQSQARQDGAPFFGSPKYLTVSSQLHLEALAQSVSKVWALSPTFRAEKSDTARHLSEFYMLEAEVAFVDELTDIMDVVEGLLRAIAAELQSSHVGEELLEIRKRLHGDDDASVSHEVLAQRWQGLISGPWPRITYNDAIDHLRLAVSRNKVHFEFAPGHDEPLQTEHERFLAESLGRGGPLFVTDYPRNIKPFYMAPSGEVRSSKAPSNVQSIPTVACFDLLAPELCEIVGGSMREHRLPQLVKSMEDHGIQKTSSSDPQAAEGSLQWYLDLRRYGSVPHGGFGLGFDRLLCYLSGVANIRDVVSFPRWHKRCDC